MASVHMKISIGIFSVLEIFKLKDICNKQVIKVEYVIDEFC